MTIPLCLTDINSLRLQEENKILKLKLQEGRSRVQELTRKVNLLQYSLIQPESIKGFEGEPSSEHFGLWSEILNLVSRMIFIQHSTYSLRKESKQRAEGFECE